MTQLDLLDRCEKAITEAMLAHMPADEARAVVNLKAAAQEVVMASQRASQWNLEYACDALQEIADEPVADIALDADWPRRIAKDALQKVGWSAAVILLMASPAWAGDMGGVHRIFPSLPDTYRSGTVELHLRLAAFSDGVQGNGFGGSFGSGHGSGGVDGYSHGTTAVSKMKSDRSGGWGGTAGGGVSRGPNGFHGGPI